MKTKQRDVADLVELERQKIAALQAERHEIAESPVPREEAAENVRQFLKIRAGQFDRSLTLGSLINPAARPDSQNLILQMTDLSSDSVLQGLLCRAIPRAIETVLMEAVDAHLAAHPPGLPSSERAPRLAELDAKIMKHEHREEMLIRQAETAGHEVVRRADANPMVVLGLAAAA